MGVRHRRHTAPLDGVAMKEFAELVYPGRKSIAVQAGLRKLIETGEALGMTAGDTIRLTVEMVQALDVHEELQPAIHDILTAFDSGRLKTYFREPMRVYVERSAVTALAVAVCESCRPNIAVKLSDDPAITPDLADAAGSEQVVSRPRPEGLGGSSSFQIQEAAAWPERTADGCPQITLPVEVWWPGLPSWEEATLTAYVSKSLAFSGENFNLLIEQEGDAEPARPSAVWLLKREDIQEGIPVFELRASTWEMGEDAHRYRFLVASSSPWCDELQNYLATRWISKGQSPTGPSEFDAEPIGGGRPPLRATSQALTP